MGNRLFRRCVAYRKYAARALRIQLPASGLAPAQVKTVHHPVKRLRPVRFLLAK
jgi:hypothetical protein